MTALDGAVGAGVGVGAGVAVAVVVDGYACWVSPYDSKYELVPANVA